MEELRRARKTSHWMWFVFPQIAGLGLSEMSRRYAIGSLAEAQAYLRHPVLGPRLVECASMVGSTPASSAEHIFGSIDAEKLRSSMTLFLRANPEEASFQQVLERYFDGKPIRRPTRGSAEPVSRLRRHQSGLWVRAWGVRRRRAPTPTRW